MKITEQPNPVSLQKTSEAIPPFSESQNQGLSQFNRLEPPDLSHTESLVLHAINPASWLSANLIVGENSPQEVDFELLNRDKLLSSLQGAEINLAAAQSFVDEVGSLVSDLRTQFGISADSHAYLLIETASETLRLDPDLLEPASLFQAFSSAKALLNPQELQANHRSLAGLASEALASMRSGQISSSEDSNQNHLSADLSQACKALIAKADALEAALSLAPAPNSPDILELFKAFLQIFMELDIALNELIAAQDLKRNAKHRLLAEFSEQLQENLKHSHEKLEKLRLESHEALTEGLHLLQSQLAAKARLLLVALPDDPVSTDLKDPLHGLANWAQNAIS
jgi:alkylhydroperoxidase/carboxymuconolactone decarboxylase family protein YurZ